MSEQRPATVGCSAQPPLSHAPPAALPPAGVAPLLEDPAATLTLLAPTNAAWAAVDTAVVDLGDRETLQAVLTFLIAQARAAGCRRGHAMCLACCWGLLLGVGTAGA